jgi:hypothetical protein
MVKKYANIKKLISNVFVKISNIIYNFSHWMEYDGSLLVEDISRKPYKIARKIYPKNFCSHCGVALERCYHPSTMIPPPYICCNCDHAILDDDKYGKFEKVNLK